jgi:Ca-activated chloride channel family protein
MARRWRRFAAGLFSWGVLVVAVHGGTPPGQPAATVSGATISGSVVDSTLAPVAQAVVTLEKDGRVVATTTADASGKFTLTGIDPGDYLVRAQHAGFPATTRALHVPAGSSALTLPIVMGAIDEAKAQASPVFRSLAAPSSPSPTASTAAVAGGRGGGTAGAAAAVGSAGPGGNGPRDAITMGESPLRAFERWPPDPRWPPPPGETYAPIDANAFQSAREHPLSTFGADVDTASYSNIRRFLSAGQLPPRDAVRIEELVNYFQFDYPAPRDGRPIGLATEIGDCPWAPSHKLVLIGARAAASASREVTGRNIVLLIDVSGSMQPPERLPLIKTAFGLFVDTLRPDDTVSIVTYAGMSGVALPPTPARDRDGIQSAIASLSAGGSTNGGEGLITAYRIARQAFVPGGVNRVILATDGDFNVGITSQSELFRLIEGEKDSGVFLSVFGVGTGNLKDRTMEMLADHGNGHYAYLDSLQEARRVLVRESDATLETVAKDVKFQVEFNPSVVAAWKLLGYEKREMTARAFNDDRKDGGEMGAGHTVTVLYEVVPVGVGDWGRPDADRPDVDPLKYQPPVVTPQALGDRPIRVDPQHVGEWLTVKARYKLPDGETSQLVSQVARAGGRVQALPFAAAAAEFGLLLRDAPHDAARWQALARRVAALDPPRPLSGARDDLKDLIALASGLGRLR